MPRRSTSKKKTTAKKARTVSAQKKAAMAAATVHYEPAPFEAITDRSKAPGKQHRHPPLSLSGVKHSEAYISKARTPFNRRMNIGR